jgi:hypothetical protein
MAALTSTLSGGTDDAVQVEVERPRLVVDKAQSPLLTGFRLAFGARFTNQGDAPIEIPERAEAERVAGISQSGVESLQSDGMWRTVESGGDVLWKGDTVFPRCKSLNPKDSLDVKGISGPFVVFKSNLGWLGTTATIRLYLVLTCKRRDGNLLLKTVPTSPFVLSIPLLP